MGLFDEIQKKIQAALAEAQRQQAQASRPAAPVHNDTPRHAAHAAEQRRPHQQRKQPQQPTPVATVAVVAKKQADSAAQTAARPTAPSISHALKDLLGNRRSMASLMVAQEILGKPISQRTPRHR